MTDQQNSTEKNAREESSQEDLKVVNNLNSTPLNSGHEEEDDDDDDEENYAYFYDEDGNPKTIRENQIGDHKVASSTVIFEEQLPDYIVDLIWKRIETIEDFEWETGMVGTDDEGAEVPDVRKCEVAWLSELDWISTIFTHYFNIANREVWEYDLSEMEQIQVTKYDKNHFYGWHSDYGTSEDKTLTRKLSASIILSDPNTYSGGKLQFIDWVGKVITPPKSKGSIIIFDSRTPHRVTPVLKGQRISLVSWMLGPKLK